jgi:hypothetical protein
MIAEEEVAIPHSALHIRYKITHLRGNCQEFSQRHEFLGHLRKHPITNHPGQRIDDPEDPVDGKLPHDHPHDLFLIQIHPVFTLTGGDNSVEVEGSNGLFTLSEEHATDRSR